MLFPGFKNPNQRMEGTTIVLMGRTGSGKSSTGNSILGRDAFTTGVSFSSTTKECQLEQSTLKDGRILKVVDTPDLVDTKASKVFLQKEIAKCIDLAKDGVHGVLYVVSIKNRFTPEEAAVLDSLQLLFGANSLNYMVVVFTGGDALEGNGMTLEEYLSESPQQLQEVLQRCNKRIVLFDNKTTSETKKEKQRSQLLKQIDNIIAENGGDAYSFEPFHEVQGSSEKLCTRSRGGHSQQEMERADQLRGLTCMMEQNKHAMEDKVVEIRKSLEEQLASVECSRKHAENEARVTKQNSDVKIRKLREELEQAKNVLHSVSTRGQYEGCSRRFVCQFL